MRIFETYSINSGMRHGGNNSKEKMAPRLFYATMSPPSRMVRIVARKIGLELDLKEVNVAGGGLQSPDFLAINPQHCLPTLDDNGLVLWESRAIATYLVSTYALSDDLYPRDPRKRAPVDHMLQFDLGTLYARINDYYGDILYKNKPLDAMKLSSLTEAVHIFETILGTRKWASGLAFTLADISLCQSFCQLEAFEFNLYKFPRVSAWYNATQRKLKPYGYEEINMKVMAQWRQMLQTKMGKEANGHGFKRK